MKKETYEQKLIKLLGLEDKFPEKVNGKSTKGKTSDLPVPVTEAEIQSFRAAQGLIYFLQAPELFTAKVCPHCKETFLVSRRNVAYCSYTCIAKDLENRGISWSRVNGEGNFDISQTYIERIYDGNEPIWIRNLSRIQSVLNNVQESLLAKAKEGSSV